MRYFKVYPRVVFTISWADKNFGFAGIVIDIGAEFESGNRVQILAEVSAFIFVKDTKKGMSPYLTHPPIC